MEGRDIYEASLGLVGDDGSTESQRYYLSRRRRRARETTGRDSQTQRLHFSDAAGSLYCRVSLWATNEMGIYRTTGDITESHISHVSYLCLAIPFWLLLL